MACILIVEADLSLRRVLTSRLARLGHSVAEADSVATAREAIQAMQVMGIPCEYVLLDTDLPDGTGWDLLRQEGQAVGASRPQAIVVATVRPAPGRHGQDEYQPAAILLKPFPLDALLQLVARRVACAAEGTRGRDSRRMGG